MKFDDHLKESWTVAALDILTSGCLDGSMRWRGVVSLGC